jgi:hypothetical protein
LDVSAIGLILSLATQESRAEHITPLFVVDEVHRLDALGQKAAIQLASGGSRLSSLPRLSSLNISVHSMPLTVYSLRKSVL